MALGGLTRCPDRAGALRVRRFYVGPTARRTGIATALATRLLDLAQPHTSTVTCNAGASDAAAPFWESMGFERTATIAGVTHLRHL